MANSPDLTTRPSRATTKLDGRTLEGGGQLVRIALCLSALTGIPIEVDNIRGNRSSGGGLKAQHLACVNWLTIVTKAKVIGAEKGSKKIYFEPGARSNECQPTYTKKQTPEGQTVFEASVDIGTAGSTGLVLQAILPYILFAAPRASPDAVVRLHLNGGTNVSGSPSFEYVTQVLLPTLHTIGFPYIAHKLLKRGWSQGRASAGSYSLDIPTTLTTPVPAFQLSRSDTGTLPPEPHLAITFLGPHHSHKHFKMVMLPAIQHHFGSKYDVGAQLSIECQDSADDKRLYLIIVATVTQGDRSCKLASDWLYDRKVKLVDRAVTEMCEKVAVNIFDEWHSGACVDEHMRDQLIIFEALAKGTSKLWPGTQVDGSTREPSLHTRTAEWVASEMLRVHFTADEACDGVGFDDTHLLTKQLDDVTI